MSEVDPEVQLAERFNKLHDKLQGINFVIDDSKEGKINDIISRSTQVQKDLKALITEFNAEIVSLTEQVNTVQKQFEKDNSEFEQIYEKRLRDAQNLEQQLTKKFDQELSQNKESINQISQNFENEVKQLLYALQADQKVRGAQINALKTVISSDLPKLTQNLALEEERRKYEDDKVLSQSTSEFKQLNEILNNQKQVREDSETEMFGMLKELVVRVKSEIEEERRSRLEAHSVILSLLEDAGDKLEQTKQQIQPDQQK